MEIWKDIEGYAGLYEASNYGFIRTHKNKTSFTLRHGNRAWKQRIMKGRGNNKVGYRVGLWKNSKVKDYKVSRIVALTFLGKPKDAGYTVNHIDGNRYNNNINNLEWLTLTDNIKHAFTNNLMPQTNIRLISNDNILSFKSLTSASYFFEKNHAYFHTLISRGEKAVKLNGIKYSIECERNIPKQRLYNDQEAKWI